MAYPIVVFSYNRLYHVRKAIATLAKAKLASESDLYICSDAAATPSDERKVLACRQYFKSVSGFKSVQVIELERNYNVKKAVRYMGDYLSQRYEAWIAIEDDVLVHENFLQFMNDALNYYAENEQVACVMGYAYNEVFERVLVQKNYAHDVLFTQAFYAFGWGTWSAKWQELDINMPMHNYLDGMGSWWKLFQRSWAHSASYKVAAKPTSELWDVHLSYEMLRKGLVAVMPVRGYVQNIGYDGSGLHKYDFDHKFFREQLNPVASPSFTHNIHVSDAYQGKICLGVIALWAKAFVGNAKKIAATWLYHRKMERKLPILEVERYTEVN